MEKRYTYNYLLLILSAFMLDGCTPPTESSPVFDEAAEIKIIDEQLDAIEEMCLEFTVPGYMAFFDDEAVLMAPNLPPIRGKEGISAYYTAFEEMLVPAFENTYSNRSFEVTDSMAVRRYENYAEVKFKASDDYLISSNVYIDVLKKQPDGSWKIKWHSWVEKKPQ